VKVAQMALKVGVLLGDPTIAVPLFI
jgi:hypothetical protein